MSGFPENCRNLETINLPDSVVYTTSTAVDVPAKIVRINGKKIYNSNKNLDHIHIPNPIQNQIQNLSNRISKLENKLKSKDFSE